MTEELKNARENVVDSPLAIGGVGGSGTRVVARICKSLGMYIGAVLNGACDNLSTPKIRRMLRDTAMNEEKREERVQRAIGEFKNEMLDGFRRSPDATFWGWKAPSTFHWIDRYAAHFAGFRYVHVIRNGLDMAFSSNQNQLRNLSTDWGIDTVRLPLPAASLEYWIRANRRAIDLGQKTLNERFFLLNYDALCSSPQETLTRFLAFMRPYDLQVGVESLLSLIQPRSIGRYRSNDSAGLFSSSQIEAVRELGFEVDGLTRQ